MSAPIDRLCQRLEQSGILSREEMEAVRGTLGGDVTKVYGDLMGTGKLTEWQAQALASDGSERLRYGPYIIEDRLGAGGMGVVYRARKEGHPRVVALKILPENLTRDENAVKRFQREVEAASTLTHPNLVAALDSGEEQGTYYYVMDYVPGENLSDAVKNRGVFNVPNAVSLLLQAAAGLGHAHAHGITHRDVKPSNLLIDRENNLRVLDLGLARIARGATLGVGPGSSTVDNLTGTGAVLGTVDYMSPEQALNTRKADHRADIYSLGCTLHYLLTGKPPYQGETAMETLIAHREEPPPKLSASRSDVPQQVEDMLKRCLAKSPADRYQTMADLSVDLESCRGKHGLSWAIHKVLSRRKPGDR